MYILRLDKVIVSAARISGGSNIHWSFSRGTIFIAEVSVSKIVGDSLVLVICSVILQF
jgi:hypothetical protein